MRIAFQEKMHRNQVWASCLNCEHWHKTKGECFTYGATPPLQVILVGCQEWEGEIPF